MSLLSAERLTLRVADESLSGLRETLAPLAKKRVRVGVILANRLVRYAVVPFDAAVSGADEELALARFHFTRIHGERAKGWSLRLSPGLHGTARLASAVDPALIDAIRACFPREARPRLVSIQPSLMAAWNRWRGQLSRDNGWLVLLEPGRACLALAAKEGWRAAQSLPLADEDAWPDLLEREALRAGTAPRLAYVHGQTRAANAPGWRVVGLQ